MNDASFDHLKDVHRSIIDSMFYIEMGTQMGFYEALLKSRSDNLLFSEETFNVFQYNYGVTPLEYMKYACSYLMKLLNILVKTDPNAAKEFFKIIDKLLGKPHIGVTRS